VNVYFLDNVGLIMNLDIEKWIENKMRHISFLFSNKDYLALSDYLEYGNAIEDFLMWLDDYCIYPNYEKVVTMPPEDEFCKIDIIERVMNKKAVREYHVLFTLWIDGEKSDLTLDCDVEYYDDNDIRFYMRDLHIM